MCGTTTAVSNGKCSSCASRRFAQHSMRCGPVAAAERRRLIELHEAGTIGDAAFQRVEQELDLRELDLTEIAAA